MEFHGPTPYGVSEVKQGEIQTLARGGRFPFASFVIPAGSDVEVGWTPENPEAGGELNVIPIS